MVKLAFGNVLATLPPNQLGAPTGPTATGVVLLGLLICMGLVGFVDDFLKVRKKNSVGLTMKRKLLGQLIVGAIFGVIALYVRSAPP